MPTNEDVTLGEVARGITAVREDISALRTDVAARPNWQDVARVEAGLLDKIKGVREDLDRVSGWGTWANRLVLAALGAAALGSMLRPPL